MIIFFHNTGDSPLKVSHELGSSRQELTIAGPRTNGQLQTFVGHTLVVEDVEGRATEVSAENSLGPGKDEVMCHYQEKNRNPAEGGGKDTRILCKHAKDERDRFAGEEWDRNVDFIRGQCSDLLREHPGDEAHFCHRVDYQSWFFAQCRFEFTEERFYSQFSNNLRSSKETVAAKTTDQAFTEHGFSVSSIPGELLQELQAYWRKHRVALSTPENHPKFDPVTSGCESDTWMLNLPMAMKMKVKDATKPLIAKWAGMRPEDLEFTSIYGIRMYRKGSKLHMHRDHRKTHVLSAILEVGQLEFGRPDVEQGDDRHEVEQWPLSIVDHNGTDVSVPNSVGQLIFYESWSCPHGRPTEFAGREMANLFVHFAPKEWLAADKSDPWSDGGLRPRDIEL